MGSSRGSHGLPSRAPLYSWAPLRHWLVLVAWVVSARRPTRRTPKQRRRKEVPGRWGIFNIVVAIIGCFYWGLEPQMAVCGELGVAHLAFLVVV